MIKAAKSLRSQVAEAIGYRADKIGWNKQGQLVCRRGFFYLNGKSSENFAESILHLLNRETLPATFRIAEHFAIYKPFRGGKSVAQNSHFLAIFNVEAK